MSTVTVTPNDRLSFTAFVAVALHVALILGVGFSWQIPAVSSPTIEVTLAQHDDGETPDNADFVADANQLGSGDADDVLEQTTIDEADFIANIEQEVMPDAVLILPEDELEDASAELTTTAASEFAVNPEDVEPTESETGIDFTAIEELAREIASLEAQLDAESQRNAKGPRIRRLTSVSTKRTSDAYYLQSWRRKVESVGNLNYPEEARRKQLYGDLTLLVTIRPDGSLKEVKVMRSSGHQVLDDAAMRIVRLAAPYPPFPVEMRKSTDLLEIVRSWQFRRNS